MRKDKNLEYVQKLRSGGVENKAMNYINDLRLVKPSAPSETPDEPEEPDGTPDYLCFTATGESTVGITNKNGNTPVLFYSTDKENWVSWDYSTITLNDGESVYFYGENPNGVSKSDGVAYSQFTMTGSIAASGNVQTLLTQKGDRLDVTEYCFNYLFNYCSNLTTPPKLPATTLADYCYQNMFKNCTSLTTAPELPATTLSFNCYSSMFEECSNLTTAPELPATTLAYNCYGSMFYGCTSLTTAPELPATTLADSCYQSMFYGCTSLTTAPAELPATTLTESCYNQMFYGCTSLTTAPELPATTLADSCYSDMFSQCSNLQLVTTYIIEWEEFKTMGWLSEAGTNTTNPTIYCPANSTLKNFTYNNSGIPSGWTQVDLQ